MDYLNNICIFYTVNDELYYESENGVCAKPDVAVAYTSDQILEADELAFSSMSFEEKQRLITDKKDVYYYNASYDITSDNAVLSSEKGRIYIWKQTLSEYQ